MFPCYLREGLAFVKLLFYVLRNESFPTWRPFAISLYNKLHYGIKQLYIKVNQVGNVAYLCHLSLESFKTHKLMVRKKSDINHLQYCTFVHIANSGAMFLKIGWIFLIVSVDVANHQISIQVYLIISGRYVLFGHSLNTLFLNWTNK